MDTKQIDGRFYGETFRDKSRDSYKGYLRVLGRGSNDLMINLIGWHSRKTIGERERDADTRRSIRGASTLESDAFDRFGSFDKKHRDSRKR